MIINSNIAAQNSIRQLGINQASTQSSLEKLSSGLRINSAADDPAGLAISEQMRGQISGLNQATTNAQSGISLVSTAEGALNTTTSVLQSMRELAVQAANGTNTSTDSAALQTENDALASTIDDIGNQTQFNTKNLLDGSVAVQTTSTNTALSAANTSASTKSGDYGVAITSAATQATVNSGTAFAGNVAGTLSLNGSDISIKATDTIGDVANKINNQAGSTGVTAIIQANSTGTGQNLVLQSNAYGSAATINVSDGASAGALTTALGLGTNGTTSGSDVTGTIDGATASGKGLILTQITDPNTSNGASGLSVNTVANNTAATSTLGTANAVADVSALANGDTLKINGKTMTFTTSTTPTTGQYMIPTTTAGLASDINSITKDTGVTAAVDTSGNLTLTSVATGSNATLTVSGTSSTSTLGADLETATTGATDGLKAAATTSFDVGVTGTSAAFAAGTFEINGVQISADVSAATNAGGLGSGTPASQAAALATLINAKSGQAGVTATISNGSKITLTSNSAQSSISNSSINFAGTTAANENSGTDLASTFDFSKAVAGTQASATATGSGNVSVNTNDTIQLQIGANQGQTMAVGISDMRSKALGVDNLDLTTTAGAAAAITAIDKATSTVSSQRSVLGAAQNRLQDTITNLGSSSQNVTTAEANIRDVDMASEMTNFQKNNVLSQAAESMLAQANQLPQQVLKLLQ